MKRVTAYKNRNGGWWMRGEATLFKNLKMADNAIGMTFASGLGGGAAFTSKTSDSLFVGESDNIGNPTTKEEIAAGRSLPKPQVADFPVRGYEFYDQLHALSNVTFVNFKGRVAGNAFGYRFVDGRVSNTDHRTATGAWPVGDLAEGWSTIVRDLGTPLGRTFGVEEQLEPAAIEAAAAHFKRM